MQAEKSPNKALAAGTTTRVFHKMQNVRTDLSAFTPYLTTITQFHEYDEEYPEWGGMVISENDDSSDDSSDDDDDDDDNDEGRPEKKQRTTYYTL